MGLERSVTGGDPSVGGGWLFPALLVVVLVAVAWVAQLGPRGEPPNGRGALATEWSPTPRPRGETAGLTIDFGNGVKKQFDALSWHKGMTVEGLMQQAVQFRPGIRFTQQGESETGFLLSLEGLENQGASGRNWQYDVNGRHAEVSFCRQKLEPGDRVLWKFGSQD